MARQHTEKLHERTHPYASGKDWNNGCLDRYYINDAHAVSYALNAAVGHAKSAMHRKEWDSVCKAHLIPNGYLTAENEKEIWGLLALKHQDLQFTSLVKVCGQFKTPSDMPLSLKNFFIKMTQMPPHFTLVRYSSVQIDMRDLKDVRLQHSLIFVESQLNNIKIDDAFPLFCSIGCLVTHMKKIGKIDSKALSSIVKIVCEYLRCPADNVVVAALYLIAYIYMACPGYLSHKEVEHIMKSVENITTISQVSLLTPVAHALRTVIVCTKDPKGELVSTCLDWYNRVYSNKKHHPLTEMACFCMKYYIEKLAHDPPSAKYLNSTWKTIQNFFQVVWPKQNTPEQFWLVKCVLIAEYLMGKKYVTRNLISPLQGMPNMDSFEKNLQRKIDQEEKSYDLYMDSNAASWTDKNYHGGHPKHYTQDVQHENYPHFNDFTATLIDASAQQELMKSGAEKNRRDRNKRRRRVIPAKYGKKAGVVGRSIDVEELEIEMEEDAIDIEDDRRSTHTMKTAVSRMMGVDMIDDEMEEDIDAMLSDNGSDMAMEEAANMDGAGGVDYSNTLDLYDEFGNYRGDKVDQLKKEREREQMLNNERKTTVGPEDEDKAMSVVDMTMDNGRMEGRGNKDRVVMIDDTIFTMQENPYVVHTLKECLTEKPVFEWCYNDLYQWLLSLKLPGLNKFNLKKYFYDYITCEHFLNLLRCNEQQLVMNLLDSQIYWPDDFRNSLWVSARLFWDLWFLAIIKKKIGESVREIELLKDEKNSLIHELKNVFEVDDLNDATGKEIFDDAFVKDEVQKYVLRRYPDVIRWNASNSIQILKEVKTMQDRYFTTLKYRKEWNDGIMQQQVYRQDISSIQLRIRKRVRELDEITRTITSHELQLREYEVQQKHYESLYHAKLEEYAAVIVSKYHYTDQKFNKPNLYFMNHLENLKDMNGHFKKQEKRLDRLIRRLEEMHSKLRKCEDHRDYKSKSDMEMLRRNFPLLMNTYFNDVQFLSVLPDEKKKKYAMKNKKNHLKPKNKKKKKKHPEGNPMILEEGNKDEDAEEDDKDDSDEDESEQGGMGPNMEITENMTQVFNLTDGKSQTLQKIEQMFESKKREILEEYSKGRTPYDGPKKITDKIREEQHEDRYGYKEKLRKATGIVITDEMSHKQSEDPEERDRSDDKKPPHMAMEEKDGKLQLILQRIKDSIEKYAKEHGISMETKVEVDIDDVHKGISEGDHKKGLGGTEKEKKRHKGKERKDEEDIKNDGTGNMKRDEPIRPENIHIRIREEQKYPEEKRPEVPVGPSVDEMFSLGTNNNTNATNNNNTNNVNNTQIPKESSVVAPSSSSLSSSQQQQQQPSSLSSANTQEEKKEEEKKEEVIDENIVIDPETGEKIDMLTIDKLPLDEMKKTQLNVLWRRQKALFRRARMNRLG